MIFHVNVKFIIYLLIGLSFHIFLSNERKLVALCANASPYSHNNANLNSRRFANKQSKSSFKNIHHINLIATNNIADDEVDNDEEDEDLDDNSSTVNTSTSNNSIQYMITNKMKKILQNDLGYTNDEINQMEPQIASVVIDRQLHRPSKGMPPTWRKPESNIDDTTTTMNNKNVKYNQSIQNISKQIKKSIKLILNNRIVHILSGATIIWYNQASITKLFYHLKNILSKPFINKKNDNEQYYPFTSRKLSQVLPRNIAARTKQNNINNSIFKNTFINKQQAASKSLLTNNNDKKILKTVNLKLLSNVEVVSIWDRLQLLRMKLFN